MHIRHIGFWRLLFITLVLAALGLHLFLEVFQQHTGILTTSLTQASKYYVTKHEFNTDIGVIISNSNSKSNIPNWDHVKNVKYRTLNNSLSEEFLNVDRLSMYRANRLNTSKSWIAYIHTAYNSGLVWSGRSLGRASSGNVSSKDVGDFLRMRRKYRPALSPARMRTIRGLLDRFHQAMTSRGLFYVICSGTLLGSYRYHGVIPWDDDADVYVRQADMTSVRDALATLPDDYRLVTDKRGLRWKLYNNRHSDVIPRDDVTWKFPFLDISFLKVSEGRMKDADQGYAKRFNFRVSDVLPLTLRPFMGLLLHAPRDTGLVLRKTYDVTMCQTGNWDHFRERRIRNDDIFKVACSELYSIYPHVVHEKDKTEKLVFQGKTLYTVPKLEIR